MGTYSSIFVASPILMWLVERGRTASRLGGLSGADPVAAETCKSLGWIAARASCKYPLMSPCIFSKTPALAIVFCLLMIPVETRAQEATPSATTDSLRADVRYLASDELRGRSVTDESIHVAARYIAGRMESVGLDTDILNGTPYQSVDTPVGSRVGNQQDNYCRVRLGDESIEAVLEDGFGPLAVGMDSGKASGPLLFVGYGITSQRHDFDDYRGFDATGAVVIILRKEPGASDPDSPFDGVKNTRHAFFATKVVNAIRHGASAVLIVNDPRSTREAVQIVRNKIDQEVRRKKQLEELLEKLPPEAKNNRAATAEKIAGAERLMKSTEVFLKTTGRGVLSVSGAGPKSDDTATVPWRRSRETSPIVCSWRRGPHSKKSKSKSTSRSGPPVGLSPERRRTYRST